MQKKVGNTLYVFDTTPFTITEDTNVEVIYVQNECLKGYLELNTELADKIHGFNQFVMTVKPAPWSDGGATEQPQNYHLLTVSDVGELYVRNYDTKLPPGNTDNGWFADFNRHQRNAGMIYHNMRNTIYCNAGAMIYLDHDVDAIETITGLEIIDVEGYENYGFVMGDSDMTVNFSYTLKPTYHVNFSADSNASVDIEIYPQERYAGGTVWIRFKNNQSSSTITVTSTDVELTYDQPNDEYSFTMPGHDVTIKAVYATEQPQNYHLLTVPGYDEGAKPLYVDRYDINALPGESPNLWFHNVNTYQRNAGMIDANVTDKIYCNAGAEVFIMRGPDEFESITGFSVIDTTNFGQRYGVIMGDSDMTVEYSYTLKPTYHVNFSADSNASADIEIYPQERYAGGTVWIRFLNNQSSSTITLTSTDVELTYDQPNDEYSFTMPGHDVTIKAVYATEQPQNYHLLTVSDAGDLYVQNYDTKLPPGGVENAWFIGFNEKQREAKMIDTGERNKIYCNAGAKVFILEDIDAFATVTGLELIDTRYGKRYGFVMGDSDMTADFSYTLKPKYHVNFSADSTANGDGYVEISDTEQYVGKNVYIRFNGGESSSTITVTSVDVELTYDQANDEYYFIMPEHDVTIKAYWPPIEISINLGDTDLTYRSDKPYDPSETYYKHAYFIVKPGNGKTTDNYTFNKSDDTITVETSNNLFTIAFINSGSVTFANA